MKKIFILTLLLALASVRGYSAETKSIGSPTGKINTNLITTILLNDLNLGYEGKIDKNRSFLVGSHLNSTKYNKDMTGDYGFFGGLRIYNSDSLFGPFMQVTLGLNHETISYENNTSGIIPSLELWIGRSDLFTDPIFIEYGIGIGKKFKSAAEPFFMAAVNIGFVLN